MELDGVVGLVLTAVDLDERSRQWTFRFDGSCRIDLTCTWRVVIENRVAITDRDHLQRFGLPAAVDSAQVARSLLKDRQIVRAGVADGPGDLTLVFDGDARLETFTDSSGYESGTIRLPNGDLIVLMGGGDTATFGAPPERTGGA